ncbi:hypothetical protein COV93_05810 [Candidatus Woesearchaeota archaeon CG11_big_fil_rev_8_21_14_0_20_43_8]|nr:MAG: hypothetical protein COV93_05810 [Candidatus Woesearchaeota archaeon CG11_big_fil_rev_8_21_14_0_20_43_8]
MITDQKREIRNWFWIDICLFICIGRDMCLYLSDLSGQIDYLATLIQYIQSLLDPGHETGRRSMTAIVQIIGTADITHIKRKNIPEPIVVWQKEQVF